MFILFNCDIVQFVLAKMANYADKELVSKCPARDIDKPAKNVSLVVNGVRSN